MNRARSALEMTAALVALVGVGGCVLLHALTGWPDPLVVGILVAALPGGLLFAATFVGSEAAHRGLAATGLSLGSAALVAIVVQLLIFVGADGRPDDTDRRLLGLAIIGAVVAGLAAPRVERSLLGVIARRTAAAPLSLQELLARIDRGLARDTSISEVIIQAAEGLRHTHRAARVEIWTGVPEHLELTASLPPRRAAALTLADATAKLAARAPVAGRSWAEVLLPDLIDGLPTNAGDDVAVAPMSASGTLRGLVVVARRGPFAEEDLDALAEVAGRLAPAVDRAHLGARLDESIAHLRRQAAELQASRSRLVSAGDDARHQIERDLHDGVQQQLVAVALNLGLAERMVADGRHGEVQRLLAKLNSETTSLAADLRSLAQGIYPPLLRDEGLGKALEDLAARAPGVTMHGRCKRHPRQVEAAVYFCCAEAVQNAQKHAPGRPIRIVVEEGEEALRFEVHDAGPGFDVAGARRGGGVSNMEDRIGALGGHFTIESGPDGTIVRGIIPV